MNPRQKVIFTQLQIASVGVLLLVFGFLWSETWLIVFGVAVMVYGTIRAWLFSRVVSKEDENEEPMDLSLDWDEEKDDDGEYAMDEWEEFLTRRFGAQSFASTRFLENELAKMDAQKKAGSSGWHTAAKPQPQAENAIDQDRVADADRIGPAADTDNLAESFLANQNGNQAGIAPEQSLQSGDSKQQNQ
ncbi:hypothetical protein IM774_01920 [Erysipelotrichaceae bacterium RD49]|nr:hypothetical protein [Erysipelotrichaceae bacterium RD49]